VVRLIESPERSQFFPKIEGTRYDAQAPVWRTQDAPSIYCVTDGDCWI
jgi:hypothetical protein